MRVHFMRVRLMGVHLMSLHLMGLHLMGLTGLHLMGLHRPMPTPPYRRTLPHEGTYQGPPPYARIPHKRVFHGHVYVRFCDL